jgi:class 3 adenylate cyclase
VVEIAFASAGESEVAYRVMGDAGRVDVVVVAGAVFPLELLAEDRTASRFVEGLAGLGRVVVFDKRGVGLSDPITDWSRSAQEQWVEDLVAVIETAGLVRPVLVSWDTNGVARLAASMWSDLFAAMVLVNPSWSTRRTLDLLSATAGRALPNRTIEELTFPSRIKDPEFTAWLGRAGRSGASPSVAARIWEHVLNYEGPLTPPGITTRTLVLHNRDCWQPEAEVRAVADVFPVAGDVDLLLREIAEFVTGGPSVLTPLRQVTAVLFTDLVDSTRRATDEGDAQWRALLDLHDRTVHQCVRDHGGRVVKYTGDGVLALLPSATAALDAAEAIRARLTERGLQIRAGIHVGDVDLRGDDVSGLAVNIAARIMSHAAADETLVSGTARRATLGSTHRFDAPRTTQLKGVPEQWTLHRKTP